MTDDPVEAGQDRPSFRYRAQVVLGILVAVQAIAGTLVLQRGELDGVELPVRAFGLLLTVGVTAVAWWGLGTGAAWAPGVAVLVLLVTIVYGVADFIVAVGQSRLLIPIGALAAVWALRADRPVESTRGGPGWLTPVLGIALVVGMAWGYVADQLLADGGPFRLSRQDLRASVVVDCGPAGEVPATLTATVSWRWTRGTMAISSPDALAVAWTDDRGGAGSLFVFERLETHGDRSLALGAAEEAGGLADAWVQSMGGRGVTVIVDPTVSGYASGMVTIVLSRSEAIQLFQGQVDIQARYYHGDRWNSGVISQPGGCSW